MKKRKNLFIIFISVAMIFFVKTNNIVKAENITYEYSGVLGYEYTPQRTVFKLYSSSAIEVKVNVDEEEPQSLEKNPSNNNVWEGFVSGDLNGKEYCFTIKDFDGNIHENILDPYGKYINKEGTRNVIFDESINLYEEWENQSSVLTIRDSNKIIYGINIENFTKHSSWKGTQVNRGKLLGLVESDVNTYLTGFDYVKSLGITYIELSRVNDLVAPLAIDNYFVTGNNAYNGELELRNVVNGYFSNSIGVILTFDYKELSETFKNNLSVIDCESYLDSEGELNLDKKMTQEYIFNLLSYYVKNYKLSGVKIENLNNYSVDFVNSIINELKKINQGIMVYGSGVGKDQNYAGANTLKDIENLKIVNGSLSYSLLGDLFGKTEKGILLDNYDKNNMESLKYALLSGIDNGEIDYKLVKGIDYEGNMGNTSSYQLINYIGNRNGLSTYDKITLDNSISNLLIQQKVILAYGTMMMSGGIPYIYSGEEFLMSYLDVDRGETSVCDSNNNFCYYTQEDEKNIDWRQAEKNASLVDAIKSLINYKKSRQSVAQTNTNVIKNNMTIYTNEKCPGLIGFVRYYPNAKTRDTENVVAIFNFSNNDYTIDMAGDGWNGLYAYNYSTRDGDKLIMKANSIYTEYKEKQPKLNQWITLFIVVALIGGIYSANIFLNKRLVEKKGYDIRNIKKKYRPFIKKNAEQQNESKENETMKKDENNTSE